jgi:moderate conductance mechanosensitive channel
MEEPRSEDGSVLDELESTLEGIDGLAEIVADNVTNDLVALLLARLISPGLSVLLIIFVAVVLSSLVRRLIGRIVARMKDPELAPTRRLRRRAGVPVSEIEEDLRRAQRADALGGLASSVIKAVIWTMAVIMVIGRFGLEIGPLIAGAGIVGVALGFGAQDLVKDFLSGVFMLIEDQYGVGDIVDAGEAIGVVEGISLRSTRIRDVDGTLWHIPNGEIRRVGNMSQDWARALLDVGVAYGTDIDAASEILEQVAVEMAHEPEYRSIFLEDPEVWGIQDLGADSVDIRLVIKVVPGQQWAVMRELRGRIKKALDSAGIEIPFPQRTVWMRTEQPVAIGDAGTRPFESPIPDEERRRLAVEASRAGGPGRVVGDLDEAMEEAVRSGEDATDLGERMPDNDADVDTETT